VVRRYEVVEMAGRVDDVEIAETWRIWREKSIVRGE
jgi:hypothetical protein